MRLSRIAPTLLGLAASALPASAKELWEYDWLEVRTPHFVIASAQDEERTVALALDLENFRAAAELVTNIGRFEERIPTKVYALPRLAKDLGVDGTTAVGLFMPGKRANYALITPQGAHSDEVLKHEYTHFLIHNRDALLYPTWIDEGFAELLSTLRVSENGTLLEFGNVMSWRADSLVNGAWISFDTVLATRDPRSLGRNREAMFYAQSWFLMHYLVIGRPGRSFAADTGRFLRATEEGAPVGEAFAAAYGLEPEAIARTLRSYLHKAQYFRTHLEKPLPQARASVRKLRPGEIAAELGVLALSGNAVEAAHEYFDAALAADPRNALALVGSGDLHKHEKRWDEAVARYEAAVALEPKNANHELDYGEYFLQRATEEQDIARRGELLIEARRHFARSYKLNPDNPETLDQNGLTYLFEGEDVAKAVESLAAAYQLLPSHPGIRRDLAAAYIQADRPEMARPHLYRLLAWSEASESERVRALIAQLPPDPNARRDAEAPVAEQAPREASSDD